MDFYDGWRLRLLNPYEAMDFHFFFCNKNGVLGCLLLPPTLSHHPHFSSFSLSFLNLEMELKLYRNARKVEESWEEREKALTLELKIWQQFNKYSNCISYMINSYLKAFFLPHCVRDILLGTTRKSILRKGCAIKPWCHPSRFKFCILRLQFCPRHLRILFIYLSYQKKERRK